MRTIHKYPLSIADTQILELPRNASFLELQMQGSTPVLWAEVQTTNEMQRVEITMFGTGHTISPNYQGRHIGTVQLASGLVWHFFAGRYY